MAGSEIVPTTDPSPSPRTNQLLQLAQDVAQGRATAQDLASALNTCAQDLEAAAKSFMQQLDQEDPQHRQLLDAEITAVLAAFDEYRAATKLLHQYSHHPNDPLLERAREALLRATARLLSAVAVYEERDLLLAGPTPNAYLNLIARFANRLRRSDITPEEYLQFVEQVEASVEAFPATLHEAADTARRLHQSAMHELKQFATSYEMRGLDRALAQLQQAASLFQEALLSLSFDQMTEGPTAVPRFNLMYHALSACATGSMPLSALQQEVPGFEAALSQFDVELKTLQTSAPHLAEHAQHAGAALARLVEFAEKLRDCESQEAARMLLDAQAPYLEAADEIAAAQQAVTKSARQAGKARCPRCQHLNVPTATSCAVCRGTLPQSAAAPLAEAQESGELMPLTEELYGLLMAVNKIAANEISAQDFLRVTATIEQMVSENEQLVYEQAAASSQLLESGDLADEDRDQLATVLRRGQQVVASSSNLIRDGLQRLQRFPHERDQRELEVGVRNVWEGFQRLYALHRQVEQAGGSSAA